MFENPEDDCLRTGVNQSQYPGGNHHDLGSLLLLNRVDGGQRAGNTDVSEKVSRNKCMWNVDATL